MICLPFYSIRISNNRVVNCNETDVEKPSWKKSGFVKWCGNDRLSNIWPKYILLSSLKFSSCQLSEQGSASSDRSIKVTNSSKQICIKNKISLSSVTWKFKRRSGTSFNLSQWIKFKICHFQLKLLLKQIKTVQKLFQFCPKLNNRT